MFSKCRACLGFSEDMKFLSEAEPDGKHLISMFTSIANFEWINSEKIASYLCNECESALEISYKFQKKCQETHEIITKLLEADLLTLVDETTEAEAQYIDEDDSSDENTKVVKKKARKRIKEFSMEEVNRAIDDYKNRQNCTFRCLACDYVLTTLRSLSTHMTQSHKEIRESWCYICNQIYDNLPEHRQTHKNLVEVCQFCNKRIKKKYFLDHLRMHSGVRPFECPICRRGFLTNSSLRFHFNKHKNRRIEGKKSLEEILYDDKNSLERIKDEDSCIGNDISGVRHNFCEHCNKNVRSLPDHVSKKHVQYRAVSEPKIYVCHICNKQYRSNSSLQIHIRMHRGDTPHKCSYCGKPHKSRAQLIDHIRTHTGEKPFICNVCGKGFAQSGALGTHMKQHTGRPEVCKICQKRFCRPSELKLHLRKHSGEKPFLCTECGKTFIQKSHLTEHAKTHSEQRPHKCAYCDKAFKQKSLLTSHLQIHSGYKPFKCTMCSYACFKAYRLQQHMKQHNNELKNLEKTHFCPICQRGFSGQNMLNSHMSSSHNAIL